MCRYMSIGVVLQFQGSRAEGREISELRDGCVNVVFLLLELCPSNSEQGSPSIGRSDIT